MVKKPKKQKAKTKKIVQKRFRITKTGKVLRRGQMIRHLKANKSKSQIRRQKRIKKVKGKFVKIIKKLLPYG
ncbi:50S ribosomal protein L35 [Candidatus Microgenomates bacterium]|nr:50S ribosomal protein L35 [Candidatus Microgenomates bacterium]